MGNCVGGKGKKDPTILTEEEIKLLLENTKLNRAQINALHQNFLRECPSGKLTKKDFVKLFKEVHPSENKKEKADKFCEYVFKVIDTQGLGYISFNDFVLCFSLTSYGDFKQKCEFAFKLYDLDRDNKISKKEMTQVLTALYDLSGITDRKKDKAPAKKVEEIMKVINTKTDEQEAAAAAAAAAEAPAAEPEDSKGKKAKKEKAPKKQKPRDFITREQFIDACSNDEALKKLFVDSIFAATSDQPSELEAAVEAAGHAAAPSGCIDLNSIALDAPAATFEVTTTSKVECIEIRSAEPIVEEVVAEVQAEAAAAPVVAEVHVEEVPVKEEAPVSDEASAAPAAEVVSTVTSTVTETVTTSDAEGHTTIVETKCEEVAVTNAEGETVTIEKDTVTVTDGEHSETKVTETVTESTAEGETTVVAETSSEEKKSTSLFKTAVTSKVVEELNNVIDSINVTNGEVKVAVVAEEKKE